MQSALKHNNSAQNQSRPISDPNKDLTSLGSQVTLGLMLNAIRTGLKQNQIRVMLGQANRYVFKKKSYIFISVIRFNL